MVLSTNTDPPHEPQKLTPRESLPRAKTDSVVTEETARTLTVISLNVCGLKSKLLVPEFCTMLQNYDIAIFCETKCDNLDMPVLENSFSNLGFTIFVQNRESISRHRSGGVMIAIKSQLACQFVRVNYSHNFLLVLKCPSALPGTCKNLVIVGVYIPPYGSRFSSVDMFHTLSDVLLDFDPSDCEVMV